MKRFSLVALMFLFASNLFAQKNVVIKGEVKGDTKGYNQVYMYTRMGSDSATIQNGKFQFEFPFENAEAKFFYTEYDKSAKMMYSPYAILIDQPGEIRVSLDIASGFSSATLSGLETAVLYSQFKKKESDIYNKISEELKSKYGNVWVAGSNPRAEEFKADQEKLYLKYGLPVLEVQLRQHPDSYASAFILAGGSSRLPLAEQERLYNLLSPRMKATEEGKSVIAKIQGAKNSAIGNTVADFTLPTPEGKDFDFSSLKGKYVMIDFWASWCVPCRQSFPRIRQVYKALEGKNFEIYSISIDKNKEAWLKAVEEESNPWPQTLDNKMVAYSGFNVTAVPTTYLIDPDGKIIMKEIGFDPQGGSEMEKKLTELFGVTMPAPEKREQPAAAEKKAGKPTKAVPMMRMN